MKSNKQKLKEYITSLTKKYLKEAEEESGNPFAAPEDTKDTKDDEAPPPAEDGEEEPKGEDEDSEKGTSGDQKDIPITFNTSNVKKYNDAKFLGNSGVVKSINKKGLVVTTQPDEIDIFVNFNDITEQVNKFFKKAKRRKNK